MRTKCQVQSVGCRVRQVIAFTLLELLTVIAIIGILAALLAPSLTHFKKGDVVVATTRQMLDDVGRARQLAIANRTTVFMVFVHTNFWADPYNPQAFVVNYWNVMPSAIRSSMVATQLFGAQLVGYNFVTAHSVGSQPGQVDWRYFSSWKQLPEGAFISPLKFSAVKYGSPTSPFYITNFPIYRFQTTNIPFPIADVQTNAGLAQAQPSHYVSMPYIAFNYLGQLCDGTGQPLGRDEFIPLAFGSYLAARTNGNLNFPGLPLITENPAGNSTNLWSYNVIHVDALTGRANLEHPEIK